MTKANAYIAIVKLSEEDKNRVRILCEKYSSKNNFLLHCLFCDLYHGEICKNDTLDGHSIRWLLQESLNTDSTNLSKILMCIARGFYWCSEEELKEANIIH